jgi:hypothetical protein
LCQHIDLKDKTKHLLVNLFILKFGTLQSEERQLLCTIGVANMNTKDFKHLIKKLKEINQ